MTTTQTVNIQQWTQQRRELLIEEKAALRQLDAVARKRRELPRVRVEAGYEFESEDGMQSLADLFLGRSQLIVYHFMYGPGWEEGCQGCSFVCDHFDGANLHLANHDVSLVCVSRGSLEEFLPFKQRMNWKFPWVSSAGSQFNYDFGASFTPEQIASGDPIYNYGRPAHGEDLQGLSVFSKDESGAIYHTYSTFARGLDLLIGAHNLLDLTPKGRNEKGVMNWVRHHDRYTDPDVASIPNNLGAEEACCDSGGDADSCCSKKEAI